MPIIEEKVVKMENDVSSPTNNSFVEPFFSIGSEVEVSTEEKGYSGAWYEATIIAPPKSTTPASNNSDSSNKSKRKIWGYWVEYKHLLDDKDGSTHLRWWTGVVVRVVGTGPGSIGCKFRVAFKDPDEELEFSQRDLRFHLDWVDGNWKRAITSHLNTALQDGSATAAKDQTNKGTSDAKKNLEISESRSDVVQPMKKLKTKKNVVEALENQHFPGPLVSWKVLTRRARKVGSVNNQSSHAMEENVDCSPAGITHSTDIDCSKQGDVEKVVDRELNEEDIGTVDVGILAAKNPGVHSLKRTGDKDGELSDPKVQTVEESSKESTKNLSDHGSLTVLQGVETQVPGSTLHDTVNEQNAINQIKLTSTDEISISAGASPTSVQPCTGTSSRHSNEWPDAALSSITTPEPSLALPFQKNSTVWRSLESMEIFAKIPQNPHFSPLAEHEEEKREELALQKMLKYAFLGDKISKLTIADLKNSMVINDILTSLEDLEECGFDVMQIKCPLDDLLLNSERQIQFKNKLDEIKGRTRDCILERAEAEKEISKIAMKVNELEKELMFAKNTIETKDQEIIVLRSKETAISDEIRQVQLDFEGASASLKQTFC
ncbi:DUF724 domain-containing protein 7-like isoform X3 [Nicotiana tomentosiformis]|uniref:DUF724 domain-containing protein 7-like isoform X3 n=1 Tax=Nicotiana tomentosiformis TaxID=4098 RepID=UPI00051BC0ED|nr:DUF724 domain-containing protein 7-like isoform X3 [Nicotiana tomentosiformis]